MATSKTKQKPAPAPAPAKKAKPAPAVASPVEEMGAEDESPSDAKNANGKSKKPPKKSRK